MNPPLDDRGTQADAELRRATACNDNGNADDGRTVGAVGDWGTLSRSAPAKAARGEEAVRFLALLGDGVPPHWLIEVRALAGDGRPVKRQWFQQAHRAGAVDWCLARAEEGFDVYVGVQPRRLPGGGSAAVGALVTLYADLDCGEGKAHASKTQALERLNQLALLGLSPAMLVDSGRGLHAYWPLREPLHPQRGREAWHGTMKALAVALDADGAVCDPPRILRVPGTFNLKDAASPKPVRVITYDPTRRLTLLDFEDLLPVYDDARDAPRERRHVPLVRLASKRLRDVIAAAGLNVLQKCDAAGDVRALVITGPCPVCPGWPHQEAPPRAGTAHIVPSSGTLRCKRARCAAGADATGLLPSGEARGIPFSRWPRLLGVVLVRDERERPAPSGLGSSLPRVPTLPQLPRLSR